MNRTRLHFSLQAKFILIACGLTCHSVLADEQAPSPDCASLGYVSPLCADCDRLAEAVKDAALAQECQACCSSPKQASTQRYTSATLECCQYRLREFPHVDGFIKHKLDSYPNVKVSYRYGASPRLVLTSGRSKDSIRIDSWKTEHIEAYLAEKLLPLSEGAEE